MFSHEWVLRGLSCSCFCTYASSLFDILFYCYFALHKAYVFHACTVFMSLFFDTMEFYEISSCYNSLCSPVLSFHLCYLSHWFYHIPLIFSMAAEMNDQLQVVNKAHNAAVICLGCDGDWPWSLLTVISRCAAPISLSSRAERKRSPGSTFPRQDGQLDDWYSLSAVDLHDHTSCHMWSH